MNRLLEADLRRLLLGGLPPERARALRERLAREPDLAAAYQRLASAWEGLALPPPAPVPLGFSGRVMAHVRELPPKGVAAPVRRPRTATESAAGALTWATAPTWVRASCAAALLTGVLLGAGLGTRGLRQASQASAGSGVPALNESYWAMVYTADEPSGTPALPSPPSPARGEARR